jgi:hypothetical protein
LNPHPPSNVREKGSNAVEVIKEGCYGTNKYKPHCRDEKTAFVFAAWQSAPNSSSARSANLICHVMLTLDGCAVHCRIIVTTVFSLKMSL